MASTVSEEVITRLTLDDRQWQQRSRAVIQSAQAITSALNAMTAAAKAANQAMGGINFGAGNAFNIGRGSAGGVVMGGGGGGGGQINFIGGGGGSGGSGGAGGFGASIVGATLLLRAIRMVEHAILDAGHEFVKFSGDALKEFASFNTIELAFEGIYGSAAKAGQMMRYLKDVAMTSAFQLRDLADAARGIAVTGLDVNRFLPMVQGFALAMGKISGAGLEDFVSILRRIQGGNTGFALGPRGIGRYGVSRRELEQYGAHFDGPNQSHFTGTVNQAFDVVEAVFKARIEKLATKVTASAEVVLSNWGDAMQMATIEAGAGIAQNLIGPIKQLTGAMNALRQAGVIKDLFDTLYQIIDVGGMMGDSSPLKTKFANKQEQDAYEKERFGLRKSGGNTQFGEAGDQYATTSGDPTEDILIRIGGYLVTMVEFSKLTVLELSEMGGGLKKFLDAAWRDWGAIGGDPEPDDAGDTLTDIAQRAGEDFRNDSYQRQLETFRRKVKHPNEFNAPGAPTGNQIPGLDDGEDQAREQTGFLSQIAEHTKAIHQRMERFAFGGNDAARAGITPVELAGYNSGHLGDLVRALVHYVGTETERRAWEILAHQARQGF